MFTGIVQGRAQVASITDAGGLRRLVLDLPPGRGQGLARGASVSVAGVCLTAVDLAADRVGFDVIDETLRRTTLGDLAVGDEVNIERAAAFGDEIGGHLISGHVWGVATVQSVERVGENVALTVVPPFEAFPYLLEKGYVSIDGCSLTLGRVAGGVFHLHLIPETLAITTLGSVRPGSRVNLEVDAMTQAVVATVERVLSTRNVG
jgi:riboflavin synthase